MQKSWFVIISMLLVAIRNIDGAIFSNEIFAVTSDDLIKL